MHYTFIKRTTIVVLLAFIVTVMAPHYSVGAAIETNTDDLENAKHFYENGDYDGAIELLNHFIEKNRGNDMLKNELVLAYYYKAKIYFTGEQYGNMENALKALFKINLFYNFPGEKNANFLRRAYVVQKIVEQEESEKKQIEKKREEMRKAKKRFPVLLVVGAVVVAGIIAYLLLKKKTTHMLMVSVGEGVEGAPLTGTITYKKGETINYNYTLKSGYGNLIVKLDDIPASAAGAITMDKDHTLAASASKTYSFIVTKGPGVDGIPETGAYFYQAGETVNYGYTLQNGYRDLVVTIDGAISPATGTILMNTNHTLTVNSTATYSLAVVKGEGVSGLPDSGAITCPADETVSYSYYPQSGYTNLVVNLDGIQVTPSGVIIMNQNHTLMASATRINKYTLIVLKGTGVDGTPESGNYSYNEGETVVYNYSLKSNYKNLAVTLDGKSVPASGTITMNGNHTLIASATK